MITCPKCQTKNENSTEECINCGIIFEKYKQQRAKALKDALIAYKNDELNNAKELFEKAKDEYPEISEKINPYLDKINDSIQEDQDRKTDLFIEAHNALNNNKLEYAEEIFNKIKQDYPEEAQVVDRNIDKINLIKSEKSFDYKYINILAVFGDVNLVISIIAALLLLISAFTSESTMHAIISFIFFLEGLFVWSICHVISDMAKNLIEIRNRIDYLKK